MPNQPNLLSFLLVIYKPTMSKTEPTNASTQGIGCCSSSIEEDFLGQNLYSRQAVLVRVWRMQLCSHTYVRITGLLSVPLDL